MFFQFQYISIHIHIRLKSEKERTEKRRKFYMLAIRVHTRESKLSPFIGQPGEGGRAAAVKRKGCM